MTSKSDLRQLFRVRLGGASSNAATTALIERLSALLSEQTLLASGQIIAGFQPTGIEPDIRPVFARLARERGCKWAYPRVEGQKLFFAIPSDPSVMTLNKWGILEPDPESSQPVELSELRAVLIPGLAFDQKLNRLGRGGGFYDRALAEISTLNKPAIKIGVAFDLQISKEDLPIEPFDIAMDWIVTESRTLKASVSVERKTS